MEQMTTIGKSSVMLGVKFMQRKKKKSEFANIKQLKCGLLEEPICYDETRTIPLQSHPSLPIKETENSLSMRDVASDTVPRTNRETNLRLLSFLHENSSSDDESPTDEEYRLCDTSPSPELRSSA
ncbi:hypothetical protein Tco_0026016 [Tanacetum coccineum]